MVGLHRHVSIISHHIDVPLLNLPGRKVPLRWKTDIGLFPFLSVDKEFPIPEFDAFPFQSHDPFQKHHAHPRQADGDHIEPFRLRKKNGQAPAEVETSVTIGWLHTDSLNSEWDAEMAKKEVGPETDGSNPDQELRGQGRKEELTNPAIARTPFSLFHFV